MITSFLVFTTIACGLISWIYSGVFLALVCENARFWKVHRRRTTPNEQTYARSCIIIPCKGMEHQLRENLTAFLRQDHPNYEVFFVVERETDPAVRLIRNLMDENRCVQSRLIIAGRAENCGQKVHNIRMATQHLHPEIDVLVFADSDANPGTSWLRWLVKGIGRENLGARTGYRWMMPRKNNFPTLVVCTINNALASMLGRGKHYLVWGGSWAIHRKVFDLVGIREAWFGVLSDDLVASRALQKAKLRVEFEPQCVCSSRVQFSTSQMFEFLRRQFLIGRRHSPKYWYATLFLVAGKRAFPAWRQHRKARKFDLFGGPVTGLLTLLTLIQSMIGNEIIWRGIRYFIGAGGRVLVLGRSMPSGDWPINTQAPETATAGPAIIPMPTAIENAEPTASEPSDINDPPPHIIPFPQTNNDTPAKKAA